MAIKSTEYHNIRPQGGWITFPFLACTMLGLGLSLGGATSNMIVYLIKEYNVESVDAAQINNIVNGCVSLAPVAGAIISDVFFGCFPVVAFSTVVNFLSLVLFILTATVPSLRPTPCTSEIDKCEHASASQLAVLYFAVALLSVGAGGSRFNMVSLGAAQFDRTEDQDSYFNWYFVILYVSAIIGSTLIVYVQDTVSWGLGYGLCAAAGAASVVMLMCGMRYCRRPKAEGSPFTSLARVVVASVRKRKAEMRKEGMGYYYGTGVAVKSQSPTQSFRFLNRAALIAEGDTCVDGSITKPWSLCTVEAVEDLKSLLRIFPLWTTSCFLSISIGIQASLTILQALTMDRAINRHFSIPTSSIIVSSLAAVAVFLPVLDRVLIPMCQRLTNRTWTPLQRVGLGHALNTLALVASALVDRKRVGIVHAHHAEGQPAWIVPMSVIWLVLPLAMTGLGEAMHFPGQVSLYYQEFPKSLRSTATGVIALIIAVGFYGSTVVVALLRRHTGWLLDNVNGSRLDKVYWTLAVLGVVNTGYYVLCSTLYEYKKREYGTSEEEAVHT
ncbi:putative protein NRT1/ PTR FAMILY 2.3 [Iris pallida]|uniref:Uncharacterized protein n=1 Tax=Iris pallida TaxID=29817 RepID=A0AAX6F5V5_IRIPA|nr:putative protein NRT1/ PTR FAMILY 2.3 [Iris pallida]